MKVIALGTGVCANGYLPGADRQPPGFLVDADGFLVLLDCSEGIRFRIAAAGYDYGSVGHIALTHRHPDHAALPQFILAKFGRRIYANDDPSFATCNFYMHPRLIKGFGRVWEWHVPENKGKYWPQLTPTFVPMKDRSRVKLAPGVVLKSYEVHHGFGKHPALCFRLETPDGVVAYSGDSGACDGLIEAAKGADLFICESSNRIGTTDADVYGHMTPREAGEVATRSRCKRLRIMHTSGIDALAAILREIRDAGYRGDAALADDGDVYRIKRR